jgi:ketosteroid isomerase-like protein
MRDHRPLGWETLRGPEAWIRIMRALPELAPDVRQRVDHLTLSGRAALLAFTWVGTREGGAFEDPKIAVFTWDEAGRFLRMDQYGLDQLDAARARFDALGTGAPRDPVSALLRPNAASAALDRLQACFEAGDWAGVRALAAPGAQFEDRRRHARLSGDADWWLSDLRQIAGAEIGDLRYSRRLVAPAGDRVCLERVLWTGGPADGRIEIEYLWLAEVDEAGRLVAGVVFDLDDRRVAVREGTARWLARDAAAAAVGRPVVEIFEALSNRDPARVRANLADDLVVHDRRRIGMGLLEGADAWLESIVALWELATEVEWTPLFHLALGRHGLVGVGEISGTLRGGGAFEVLGVSLFTVAGGRINRFELFELEDADAALARFAELRPDPAVDATT